MDNKATIEQWFTLIEKQDWDAFEEFVADEVIVEYPQSRERIVGKDACLRVYRNYPGGSPALKPRRITGAGDLVVAEASASYPDGSDWEAVSIFEFRDGKIIRETAYFGQAFEAPEWRKDWVERF